MFESIRERLELQRLQKARRLLDRDWSARVKGADRENDRITTIYREWSLERETIDDLISQHQTASLRRQAEDLFLPLPPFDDEEAWISPPNFGARVLSPKAIVELRSAIRKENREAWEFWAGRITTGTGLVGALIGLVAIFKK